MSVIKVYNRQGTEIGEVPVADELLVLDRGEQAVKDVIVAGMAANRAGTASTKRKGEVAGSNKKPWKQKGTGRARAGLKQSPVWRGGGVAFGPHPRDFSLKVNKKVVQLAFRRALSDRIVEGGLKLVDDLTVTERRTKLVTGLLKNFGDPRRCLLVTPSPDPALALAARNLANVAVLSAENIGVYHVMHYPTMLVAQGAWGTLEGRLAGTKKTEKAQ
ncbi:MAG: 50S ribosomal protein L4 [Kiritimatiellaeota bacterium]|nr:50S ribosomal protein L4 [Kiritimatiellota bacterium]